ncbi:ABC-type oligopeptide transport system substrate-binding subunit [Harryflintia acetispora]|uniref:ABC-type oligopeptide transport system substrate-binding subunit n=1 Tax=Harryflintia acetispora TaxID=1849041 RepID=A0A9X8Y7S7_9FIRM|nr:ABC-type oligopeptide transport system substrate-binding subunit [Harryflintia acetispora]
MKKYLQRILSLFLIFSLILPLAACSDGTGAALRYDISTVITNLDPQYADGEDAKMVIRNVFEGLFCYDEEGKAVPAAAESYGISADGLVYTFQLREGMHWSDEAQTPITANDFEFALKRLYNRDYQSPFADDFLCLKNAQAILGGSMPPSALGVKATGTYTLEITLEYPAPQLPELLCSTAAMPCNEVFFTETKGRYGLSADMLLYNGPFYVRLWEPEEYIQLRKSDDYRAPQETYPARVTLSVTDGQEHLRRFQSGKTDAAVLSYDELQQLRTQQINYEQFEDIVWVMVFNQRVPFLENRNARKALAGAVNHAAFAPLLGNDLIDSATFLPPSLTIYSESYRKLAGFTREGSYRPKEAKESWARALQEAGEPPVLTLLTAEGSSHPMTAGAVQKSWRDDLALVVNMEQHPLDELSALVQDGQYQIAILPMRPASSRPEEMLADFRSSSGRNLAGYQSKTYDALLERAEKARGKEELLAACKEAEELLYQDAVLVPLYYQTSYYVTPKKVSGIYFSPFAGEISFQKAVKK